MYKLSQKAQKIHILSNFIIIILLSPKPALQAQYTHSILFKVQEYLCLAIFEKLIIQVHDKTILSIKFKSVIKTYGLNLWRFQRNSNPASKAHDSISWQIIY